jgi:hypothetical protein
MAAILLFGSARRAPRPLYCQPILLSTEEILRIAVVERRPVTLEYRRRGQGLRLVHPHALYPTAAKETYVDVYQVRGHTSAGRTLPGWRAFDVAQVVHAELRAGRFALAPGYNPTAPRYRDGIVAPA